METAEGSVLKESINGFSVIRIYDKIDKTGSLIVTLAEGDQKGAMLLLSFEGMTAEDALEVAKQFDWVALQEVAQQYLLGQ